jgi:hypothetical protein
MKKSLAQISDVLFFKNALSQKKFPFYAFVVFKREESVRLAIGNRSRFYETVSARIYEPN